ncbi:MAG: trypsin-like peptidase domain-containing protein [Myxococcales bacterium]|nr:trypsin-like peptidase domain-containing protein [Myxococcales bacterium]
MSYMPVVRVFATTQRPDYENPWQSQSAQNSTGSGVVVAGRYIVTGAHVVADATFLQVQKISDPDKAVARVVAVGHDCDLALLTVDDDSFWADLPAATLGPLPQLRDQVQVVGFPTGGDELSVTEGVVSRIEVQRYSHSQRYLLAITVDAAINAGNSGGPVFQGDTVVGIAFQTLADAENVGELVPAVFIHRLLESAARAQDLLVPGIGVSTQGLENPTLRASLGMAPGTSGVLVTGVAFGSSAWGVVKTGDVLCGLDGHPIANNQTVRYQDRIRTHFAVILADHHVGDRIAVVLLRDGQRLETELVLAPHTHLVPANRYDTQPHWYLWGGLVFQVLCRDYLETWSKWWANAPRRLVDLYYNGERTEERQEILVISQVLADELTVGYEHFYNRTVNTVNGEAPVDLAHLARLLDGAQGHVEICTDLGERMVFDAQAVRGAASRILSRYRIPTDRGARLARD